MLTGTPMSVNSIRLSDPTWPATTSPVSSPIPTEICGLPALSSSWLRLPISLTIVRAAESARSAWSVIGLGAPKTTSMPSPWNLSMFPPCSSTASIIREK